MNKSQHEMLERVQALSPMQMQHLRERFCTDLYFGSKYVLGYDQLEENCHGPLCAFMVHEQANRRMVLMPRGFLKSTICTIADSIRLSCINPNVAILLQNEVFENAALFLDEIKNHWVKNLLLRAIFSDLAPRKTAGPNTDWSKVSASIERSSISRMSTYTASGSGGSPQSQHFHVIKNDDLIGERARTSEAEMAKAIQWSDAMTPLLDRLDDQMDFYGTRKTMTDVYAHVMEKYEGRIKVFIREPIENGHTIFEKFPTKELIRIMVETPDVWAYDYMNNPLGKGGLDWGRGKLRNFHFSQDERHVVFNDHLDGTLSFYNLGELDIVITADPNSGKPNAPDKAAIVVHGIGPKQQIFVLDSYSGRDSHDGFVQKLWDTCYKWKPRLVGIEDGGNMTTLYYFEKKCMEEGIFYNFQALKHKGIEKETRIRRSLDTPLKARRIFVLADQTTLISQIQLFPQLAQHNWDEIDAFAYGPQLYGEGMTFKDQMLQREAEEEVINSRGITGYGASV